MRTQKSSNPVVKLLIKIKEFNDENSLILGENNLFTSPETENKNHKVRNKVGCFISNLLNNM
jgi:hypothetical protein